MKTSMFSSDKAKKAAIVSACVLAASGGALAYSIHKRRIARMKLTKLRFNLSVQEISQLTNEILEEWKTVEDEVALVKDSNITYSNTAGRLAQLEVSLSAKLTNATFLAHVSPDKAIRDACTAAETKLDEYEVKSAMREDVYRVIKILYDQRSKLVKGHEEMRYVERLVRDFERNGLGLDKNVRKEVEEAKQRLSKLGIEYQKNLNEENTVLEFTSDELKGLTPDFINGLELVGDESGKLKVPLKYPQVFPILKTCQVPSTREAVEKAFNQRCMKTNVDLLEEMVRLRHRVATLLKFPNHASYILDVRMAKSTTTVRNFLSDLNKKLEPLVKKELEELLKLKKDECKEINIPFTNKISMADFRYYMNMYEQKNLDVDHEAIREYFPMSRVTNQLLSMYEELLSLRFVEIKKPHVWHNSVRMFQVLDARENDTDNLQLVGYFYLDLFPRPGKYGHAACFGLQPSCINFDTNKRQVPVAAMVANFAAPTKDKPSLLSHSEVVTYFHEFGHVMHQICSEAKLRRFAGTAVERDFVEAPSQMLENWCWEKEPLRHLSGHYLDENKPLPDSIIKKLIATKNANAGLLNKRQLLFATFDQTIHTQESANTAEVLADLQRDIMKIEMTPDTNFAASFGHLAGGYDAQYYGYMWSEVYSMDMFASRFKKDGLMNARVGRDYREIILGRGGSKDAIDLLREFLGRDPSDEAFLKSKGL